MRLTFPDMKRPLTVVPSGGVNNGDDPGDSG